MDKIKRSSSTSARAADAQANLFEILRTEARARLCAAHRNLFAMHHSFDVAIQANLPRSERAAAHNSWDDAIREYTEALAQYAIALADRVSIEVNDLPEEQRKAA